MKYQIGQYVLYRNHGVCRIEAIGKIQFLKNNEKEYYTLRPPYQELLTSDAEGHLQLFKEICQKEEAAEKKGKRLGETERQYKKKVEQLLSEELAIALHETPDESVRRLYMALSA